MISFLLPEVLEIAKAFTIKIQKINITGYVHTKHTKCGIYSNYKEEDKEYDCGFVNDNEMSHVCIV